MSPDLEIIMMVASILEKSKLIYVVLLSLVLMHFLVTQSL